MEGEKTGELLEQSLNKCRRFRGEAPAFFFSLVPSLAPLKCTAVFTEQFKGPASRHILGRFNPHVLLS
jgi:hypothetical protein